MAYMKLPFTLDKPSENEWVTEADKILYKDNKSVKDAIEEGGGGGVAIPFTVTKDTNNTPLGMYSNAEPNFLGKITDGSKNSTIFGAGSWADGDRVFSVSQGTPTITFSMSGNNIRITQIQGQYVYALQNKITSNDFQKLVEGIICRNRTDYDKPFDITLTFVSLTKGLSNNDSYITATPSVTLPAGTTSLSYYSKLSARTISLGQSNLNNVVNGNIMLGFQNTDLAAGNYKTFIGGYNTNTNTNSTGSHVIIGRSNILTGTTAPAFIVGYNNTKDGTGYIFGSGNKNESNSITLGQNNTTGQSSFTVGFGNNAGDDAFIYGGNNTIDENADRNYVYGFNNTLDGDCYTNDIYGTNNNITNKSNTLVIGNGNVTSRDAQIVIGKNLNPNRKYIMSIGNLGNALNFDGSDVFLNDKQIALKEDIDIVKTPNVTIFGELTNQQGQISGFSSTNYAQFPFLVDFKDRAFEINMCFTTGSNVTTQENIFDSIDGLAFAVRNGKFVIAMSSDGKTWNMGEHIGTQTVTANTTYFVKFSWNRLIYKLEVSTDKSTYTTDITVTDTRSLYAKQIIIGKSIDGSNYFSGSINLNYCNLYIMGNEVWQGMDDVGLATRLATDLSNIDAAGEEKIKEIAGQSSGGLDVDLSNISELGETKIKDLAGSLAGDGLVYEYGMLDLNTAGIIGKGLTVDGTGVLITPDIDEKTIIFDSENKLGVPLGFGLDYVDGAVGVYTYGLCGKTIATDSNNNFIVDVAQLLKDNSGLEYNADGQIGVNYGFGLTVNDNGYLVPDYYSVMGYGLEYHGDTDTIAVMPEKFIDPNIDDSLEAISTTDEEGHNNTVLGINFDSDETAQELEFEFEDGTTKSFKFIAKEV